MRNRPRAKLAQIMAGILAASGVHSAAAQVFSVTPDLYSIFTPSPTPAENRDPDGPVGVAQRFGQDLQAEGIWLNGQHAVPSATLSSLYDSNIFATSSRPSGDLVTHFRPALDLDNGQQQIAYSFNLYADLTKYAAHSSLDNINSGAALSLIADIDPTLRLESRTSFVYGHADPATFVLPVANAAISRLPDTEAFAQQFSATRDVGLWGLSLSGGYARAQESDITLDGTKFLFSALNSNVVNVAPQVAFDLAPDIRSFVRAEYRHENEASGTYNAGTYTMVTGFDFELHRLVKGTIDVGYREHSYDRGGLGSVGAPTYGLNLVWYPTDLMTVTLTGAQDFSDSILVRAGAVASNPGSAIGTVFTGVPVLSDQKTAQAQIDYSVMRELLVSAVAAYSANSFAVDNREDDVVTTGVGLLYSIDPMLVASAQYRFSMRTSTASGIDYNRNQAGIALKLRF